jgi:hypothetical protein
VWQVDAVLEAAKSGRNRALILQCSSEGESRDMIVKTIDQDLTDTGLFCEYFGNLVAREAGLSTPEPALIAIDDDTSSMINESSAAKSTGKLVAPGVGVGSRFLRPAPLPPRTSNLTSGQVSEAAAIYVYDLLVHHPDRRRKNPNVVMVRGHFVAIDFDMTFSFLWAVGNHTPPWQVSKLAFPADHYFHDMLRGERSFDWDVPVGRSMVIDVPKLRSAVSTLPPSWHVAADRVLSHLEEVIDHGDEFRWEVLRTVS